MGFRASGWVLEMWIQGLGMLGVHAGFWVQGLGFSGLGAMVQGLEICGIWELGFSEPT